MYYGHGKTNVAAPTTAERNEYVATQAMVWIIEKNLFGTAKADSAAQKICACAPSSTDAYNFYVALRNNMQAAMNVTIPSFASSTKSGAPTYELKWNEANKRFETTLSDTNGCSAMLSGKDPYWTDAFREFEESLMDKLVQNRQRIVTERLIQLSNELLLSIQRDIHRQKAGLKNRLTILQNHSVPNLISVLADCKAAAAGEFSAIQMAHNTAVKVQDHRRSAGCCQG